MIDIIVNGVNGKMGRVIRENIATQVDLRLVAGTGRRDDLTTVIKITRADVVIDFTTPSAVFSNTKKIIDAGARPVIGTTGLTAEQIDILSRRCRTKKLGGIVAPNFFLGAILMMKYAKDASRYFPDSEIVEMHHPQKTDAPSGTAIRTAQMMTEVQSSQNREKNISLSKSSVSTNIELQKKPLDCCCNTLTKKETDIPIHSVRLPGLFSHQLVLFGGKGEVLTIRHDGTDRKCMVSGIFIACRKVMELDRLVYGLENLL
ncbi:4-hydroxy-tetrahydrodipicolinate reductase [Coxiella endosymbiont of Amblyomma sculptum]|uniref:4-hydroxy-tetrahydrodipicolinate reductase n=1 Tax=Coxiella endosymbiont of Amblyomma sculptum TaxID=2487929 RepID=UPI00132F1A1C|nr:4-hydroxy-tetrahydrodipicolinate reductase [Coxiella endosymbiont of Amblyomma sculptum]QHG92260.1 4-hydroxy-tetrahydrodipicolinate reductase [Coxiella endosymbiont of Amblyomma sculptum]